MSEHDDVVRMILSREERPLAIDAEKTALLIIDVQANFVDGQYNFGRTLEAAAPGVTAGYFRRVREQVVPNIRILLGEFRKAGRLIFYTGTGTLRGNSEDLALWAREFDGFGRQVLGQGVWPRPDEPPWQICDEIKPLPHEPVLNKTAADPTICTSLLHSLRCQGIKDVIVTGLVTDVCVTSTARACADQGFQVIIASDACTTLSEVLRETSLLMFSGAFGRARTTAEIMRLLTLG